MQEFIDDLTTEDIRELCPRKIFDRGEEYFESGAVSDVSIIQEKALLEASVEGNQEYNVRISMMDGDIWGSCSCPFEEGICKHIIAVLLYCIDNPEDIDVKTEAGSKDNMHNYLISLSKDQLIEIILKYASDKFHVLVRNMNADLTDAKKSFHNVRKKIVEMLTDDGLLSSPADMENSLSSAILKLTGFEVKLRKDMQELIFFIIKSIDNAIDQGYLYEDNHYTDDTFQCPEEFTSFVMGYVKSLKFNDKMSFLIQLETLLGNCSYNTFDELLDAFPEMMNDGDLPALKTILVDSDSNLTQALKQQFYLITRSILSDSEREKILTGLAHGSEPFTIELVELYRKKGQDDKALSHLKKWISEGRQYGNLFNVYAIYLDIVSTRPDELKAVAQSAINDCPSVKMLLKLAELLPSDLTDFENIVETKNPDELLHYLESMKRLEEALALIKKKKNILDLSIYDFYKKHKLVFPKETKQYMGKVIARHLDYTGNSHYREISEALRIISMIDAESASAIAQDIRKNHNRRRNLIRLIEEF